MHPKYEKALRLREFKAKQLAKIAEVKALLVQKYPERTGEITEIINKIVVATNLLKTFKLPDYISMLYLYASRFPEIEKLIPSTEEVKKLVE